MLLELPLEGADVDAGVDGATEGVVVATGSGVEPEGESFPVGTEAGEVASCATAETEVAGGGLEAEPVDPEEPPSEPTSPTSPNWAFWQLPPVHFL